MFYQFALPFKRSRATRTRAKPQLVIKDLQRLPEDPRYWATQQQLQQGAWQSALATVATLQASYPASSELTRLHEEATWRLALDSNWEGKVKERTRHQRYLRQIGRAVLLLLLSSALLIGLFFVTYTRQANPITPAAQALLAEAQTALQAKQYRTAVERYRQVLATQPLAHQASVDASRGLEEAVLQLKLLNQYEAGVHAMATEQWATAGAILTDLEQRAPNYRDTQQRLHALAVTQVAAERFARAEAAYQSGQWAAALAEYEALLQFAPNYKADRVLTHLIAARARVTPQP